MVKSTGCSSRGPGFNSRYLNGESQQSITVILVPGDLTASSALQHTHSTHTYMQAKHSYMLEKILTISKLNVLKLLICKGLVKHLKSKVYLARSLELSLLAFLPLELGVEQSFSFYYLYRVCMCVSACVHIHSEVSGQLVWSP